MPMSDLRLDTTGDAARPWWEGAEVVQIVGHSAYGGGVPVIFEIMKVTRELGMRPVILATHPDVVRAARREGLDVWEFPGIVREPRPFRDLLTSVRLAAALKRRGVKIVHTHTSKGGMVGRLGAWIAGCDLVIHHTHGFYHAALKPGVRRSVMIALERVFARLSDIQVFVNSAQARHARDDGIVPHERIRIVFNGVPEPDAPSSEEISRLRRSWGLRPGGGVIGIVCRLDIVTKGLDDALNAFARVVSERPDTVLVITGSGDDRDRLEALVRTMGLSDSVRLIGHVERAGKLNRAFDVTFAPSRREGQSISVMEAMACDAPIVATRIDGTADLLIDRKSALLVDVGDVGGMATALLTLLDDHALADGLGAGAGERYRSRFTVECFDAAMRDVYRDALEKVTR